MRLLLTALAILSLATAAGCGDGAETTVTQTGTDPSLPDEAGAGAPSGELLADGIGEVGVGDSPQDVSARFGEPSSRKQLTGCELNPADSALVQYVYDQSGGSLAINFEAAGNEMASYFTDSPELATSLGDRVGDSYADLDEHWGASLEPLVLGTEQPSAQEGTWFVQDGPKNQLIFVIEGGRVTRISGGYQPPCE